MGAFEVEREFFLEDLRGDQRTDDLDSLVVELDHGLLDGVGFDGHG